jgi:cation diffusion facilitator family transporter
MRRCELTALSSAAVCGAFAAVLLILAETRPHFSIVAAVFTGGRAVTGLLVYAGLRLSRRRSDAFAEGLYKLENLVAVAIGVLVIVAAWELGRYAASAFAAGRDLLPAPLESVPYLLIAAALAAGLGAVKIVVARADGCPSLRADAWHSILDAVALSLMTVGAVLAGLGVQRADELVAFLACAILFATGARIVLSGLKVLLDASVEGSVLSDVERVVGADPRVARVVEVAGRNAGSYRLLTVRLTPQTTEVAAAEALCDDLRHAVRAQVANVGEVVVELVPAEAAGPAAGLAGEMASPGDAPEEGATTSASTGPPRGVSRAERAEIVSTVISAAMAALMITVAMSAGSVAVLAEGTDTVVDVVASVAVLVGMRLARRHSRTFPQGLYKIENLTAAAIGILVLVSAWELGREAIDRLVNGAEPLERPLLVLMLMLGVVVVTAALGRYKARVGRQERSPSLQADGRHALSDAAASAGVALGVGLQWAGVPHTDSIAALAVVALLAWTGVEVLLDALRVLLDASLERDVLDQIRVCVEEQPGVRRVLTVRGRNSGAYRFVNLTVVPEGPDLDHAERILGGVRRVVRERFENIDRIDVELAAG